MAEASDPPLSLSQVLGRVSRQLSLLAVQARTLEEAGIGTDRTEPLNTHQLIKRLQGIDHLRQSIEDLGTLTHLLAARDSTAPLSRDDARDTAARLQLSATRLMLDVAPFGTENLSEEEMRPTAPGDAQLF